MCIRDRNCALAVSISVSSPEGMQIWYAFFRIFDNPMKRVCRSLDSCTYSAALFKHLSLSSGSPIMNLLEDVYKRQ